MPNATCTSQTSAFARILCLAVVASAVIVGTAFLYVPGLHGPFMMDDWGNIQPTRLDEFTLEKILTAVFANESGRLGRPVSAFSFALTTLFHGMDSFYFKYQNLMLHLLNGVMLFWLSGRLLRQYVTNDNDAQKAWLAAGIAAAIWLVHPLWVSTVLYAVQRMAQLSMLFSVLALLAYVSGRQRIDRAPGSGLAIMVTGTTAFGALAVFSKENGALLPLYILAIEVFAFRFRTSSHSAARNLYLFQLLFIATPLLIGAIYFLTHLDGFMSSYATRTFTLSERLMTEARVVWFYISLLLIPRLSSMSLFHDDIHISTGIDATTLFAIAGIAVLVSIAALSFRRHPVLGLGIAWFVVSHLLESTIFPLELVFEHRNYMAAAGIFLAVGFYTTQLLASKKFKIIALTTCVLILSGLASMTYARAISWGDSELFYRITLMEHPNSFRALTAVANVELMNNQPEAARQHIEAALKLAPETAGTKIHLLYTYCHADSLPPRLVEDIIVLVRTTRLTANDIVNMGTLSANYFQGACPTMTPDILLNIAYNATENRMTSLDERYYLLVGYGQALQLLGQHEEAVHVFNDSLPIAKYAPPTNRPLGLVGLAHSYIELGNLAEAKNAISQLRELDKHPLISLKSQIEELEELL